MTRNARSMRPGRHARWRTLLAAGAAAVILAGPAGGAGAAPAANVVGNGTQGSCTESLFAAAVAAGGTVTFDCGGPKTITLTSAVLAPQAVTIDGGNAITLTGNLATQLLFVDAGRQLALRNIILDQGYATDSSGGAIGSYGILSLDHVRIQNSKADHFGGAILAVGPLDIQDSSLMNNSAPSGGAIYAETAAARLTLTDTTIMFNQALDAGHGLGGGIGLTQTATLQFSGGAFGFNTADKWGGGLYLAPGSQAAIVPSSQARTWLGDNAGYDSGGAIYNDGGQLALVGADLDFNNTLTATSVSGEGGAIDSSGALTLTDSTLFFNLARFGGGLFVRGATATAGITRTQFLSNTASDTGGGLYAFSSAATAVVTVDDSSFDNNHALTGGGGGLARTNAHLAISRSSFTHNDASRGGGLFVQGLPDPDSAGYVEIRDSTISANAATTGHSGGIENSALLDLRNVTLKDNGYGLYLENGSSGSTIRLQSSVLDNAPLNCDGTGTAPASGGHNLSTNNSCGLSVPFGDQSSVPAGLGPLTSDPHVLTLFHLPLAGSLLINAGGPGCSATDQRGALRQDACDIGAIELSGLLARLWLPLVQR